MFRRVKFPQSLPCPSPPACPTVFSDPRAQRRNNRLSNFPFLAIKPVDTRFFLDGRGNFKSTRDLRLISWDVSFYWKHVVCYHHCISFRQVTLKLLKITSRHPERLALPAVSSKLSQQDLRNLAPTTSAPGPHPEPLSKTSLLENSSLFWHCPPSLRRVLRAYGIPPQRVLLCISEPKSEPLSHESARAALLKQVVCRMHLSSPGGPTAPSESQERPSTAQGLLSVTVRTEQNFMVGLLPEQSLLQSHCLGVESRQNKAANCVETTEIFYGLFMWFQIGMLKKEREFPDLTFYFKPQYVSLVAISSSLIAH